MAGDLFSVTFLLKRAIADEQVVEKFPTTIEDKNGATYNVDKEGNIKQVSSKSDVKLDDKTKYAQDKVATIQFESIDGVTKYALDAYNDVYKEVAEFEREYIVEEGNPVRASIKFMEANSSDDIFVRLVNSEESFDPAKVHFVTDSQKEYKATYNAEERGWRLILVGSDANDGLEVFAVYKKGNSEYSTLAILKVVSYEPKSVNIALVPVNGAKGSFTDIAKVKDELNKVYNKVGITVNVSLTDNFDYTLDNFDVTGSGLFSTRTNDMKAIESAFMATVQYKENTAYLFIMDISPEVDDNSVALGDMPRKSQFGYLFKGASANTVAHEIGHGLFHLDHPFARANAANSFSRESLTDNLMHYHGGCNLAKLQWDAIHAPGLVIGVFEKDGDGMSHRIKDISTFLAWLKENLGNEEIQYNKDDFYDGSVLFDHTILVESLDIKLFIEFSKSGNINLGKTDSNGYPGIGVEFDLDGTYHNGFYFNIRYADNNDDAIKIWFYSYEDFSSFLSYLGISLTKDAQKAIIEKYKTSLDKAGNDCNKLDVIYETIPDFVIADISDEILINHLKILSSCEMSNSTIAFLLGWGFDTDDERAVLNILKNIKDRKLLYDKLYASPRIVENLYQKIDGDNVLLLLGILYKLTEEYGNNDNTKGFIYLGSALGEEYKNSAYLYDYPYILTDESKWDNLHHLHLHCIIGRPNILPFNVGDVENRKEISRIQSVHPLDFVKVYFDDENTIEALPAVYAYHLGVKNNRDEALVAVNKSVMLCSGFISLKMLFNPLNSNALRAVAASQLGKLALDAAMYDKRVIEALSETEDGKWLVDNWPVISIFTDISLVSVELRLAFIARAPKASNSIRHIDENVAKELDELVEAAKSTSQTKKVFDEAFEHIEAIQNLRKLPNVTVRTIDDVGLNELLLLKSRYEIGKLANIASVDIISLNKPLNKKYFVSHSGFDNFNSKIPNGSSSPNQNMKIFKTWDAPTVSGQPRIRHNDAEVKIFEDIASQLGAKKGDVGVKTFNDIEGKIVLKTELCPCASCSGIIEQFKNMFPNVELEIFTQPKISF